MFLTAYNLATYLTATGQLPARAIVDGDFVLIEAGRRNRNFKVVRREDAGLFVKQIKSQSAEAMTTLRREALLYRAVAENDAYMTLRPLVPEFVNYDERRHAVSVRLVPNRETLAERSMYEGVCDTETSTTLGQALATVHEAGSSIVVDNTLRSVLTFQPPWPLMLDRVGYRFLEVLGPIGPALSAQLRAHPTLSAQLTSLRALWQFDSLMHGDMKWDNCLVSRDSRDRVVIVDWEMFDVGDGAWDVAGILKEYVAAALGQAMARPGTADPRRIETLAPSASAFWNAYAATRRLANPSLYFDRAVRLTGARLVIAVLEFLMESTELGDFGQLLLRTSAQMLEMPQVAAAQFLGQWPQPAR